MWLQTGKMSSRYANEHGGVAEVKGLFWLLVPQKHYVVVLTNVDFGRR